MYLQTLQEGSQLFMSYPKSAVEIKYANPKPSTSINIMLKTI